MAMSFAAASVMRSPGLVEIYTIEGLGSAAGQDRFCDRVPAYADGDARYKPWFKKESLPSELPQDISPLGGIASSGAVSLAIADGVGIHASDPQFNYLTKRIGSDTLPDLELGIAIDATTDPVLGVTWIGDASTLADVVVDAMLFCGFEAFRVTAVTGSTSTTKTVTMARAQLDTEIAAHSLGDAGYLALPGIAGRRVRRFYAYDLPGFTEAMEVEVGPTWIIDGDYDLDENRAIYQFNCLTNRGLTHRPILRKQWRATILSVEGEANRQMIMAPLEDSPPDIEAAHFDGTIWFQIGDEVLLAEWPVGARGTWLLRRQNRGALGTRPEQLEPRQIAKQVFCSQGREGASSFAYQEPNGETNLRSTGIWVRDERSEHPIPAALCALASSAGNDGLELVNWTAGSGNFSALPPGVGAGIKIADVHWQSAHEIWARHPEWRLPALIIDTSMPVGEWLDKNILRPFGLMLAVVDGQIKFFERLAFSAVSTETTWDETDIVLERQPEGGWDWAITQGKADELSAGSIVFRAKNIDGIDSTLEFNDQHFPEVFGRLLGSQKGDGRSIDIPVPGALFDGQGAEAIFEDVALSFLIFFRRPPWKVVLRTDMSKINDKDLFGVVRLSHPDLVNDATKSRGWVNVPIVFVGKVVDRSTETILWTALASLEVGRIGVVAPAVAVGSVGIVDGDGNYTITCPANRYTDASMPAGLSLPASDVEAFEAGQEVRLELADGTPVVTAPTFQTIVTITPGTTMKIDGNFGGAISTAHRIVLRDYDDQAAADQLKQVSYADANRKLGAGDDDAFQFGGA